MTPPVDDAAAIRAWLDDRDHPEDDQHDTICDLLERLERAVETGSVEAVAWYRRRLRLVRQGIEAAVRDRVAAEGEREEWRAAREAQMNEEIAATTGEGR